MNRPIILDNAVERNGENNKTFQYDYSKDMNVVKMDNLIIPFINMGACNNELYTKTEVERERDDEEISFAELQTKTSVERERDDEDDISFN